MKTLQNKQFYFQAGERAVLLLHGFTGSSADVRMLGRFLEKNGYTSFAAQYTGHGAEPEQLVKSHPDEWWQDVLDSYAFLQQEGYDEIAVAGLSLGGLMSMKLATIKPVKGVVTMCAPMMMRTTDLMFEGVLKFAYQYKRREGKEIAQIETELARLRAHGMPSLPALQQLVKSVREEVDMIYAPIFIAQSTYDDVIDPKSAQYIYEQAQSSLKELKWYDKAGHVITLSKQKDELHEDILSFLNRLDWHV